MKRPTKTPLLNFRRIQTPLKCTTQQLSMKNLNSIIWFVSEPEGSYFSSSCPSLCQISFHQKKIANYDSKQMNEIYFQKLSPSLFIIGFEFFADSAVNRNEIVKQSLIFMHFGCRMRSLFNYHEPSYELRFLFDKLRNNQQTAKELPKLLLL